MKKRIILIIVLGFVSYLVKAQETVLDKYIQSGLENNSALKQKQTSYQKSLYELKEADALFYPSVSLNARYTMAHGGRTVDLPVGDMMNPVYSTLHDITYSAYQIGIADEVFPDTSIDNESINFLRKKEHETKLELIQPIISPDIFYNRKIKKNMTQVEQANVYTYKNYLIAEIKKAYFTYLKVNEYYLLLNENMKLADENIRINEKLFENNKVTMDAVYRARSEKSKLEQMIASAEKDINLSQAYFNFLIGQPLENELKTDDYKNYEAAPFMLDSAKNSALNKRGELMQLDAYLQLTQNNLNRNKYNRMPNVYAIADYGFQGEKYSFTDKDDFIMASFVLKWDLFGGWKKSAQIQQAKLEKQLVEQKLEETKQKISMEVISGYYDLETSLKSIKSAQDELKYSKSAFKIVNEKYKEGSVAQIEYIDAYTNQLDAGRKLIIEKYDYLIKKADFERTIVSLPINTMPYDE